jgi:glycosyltransferase involved in cell wall biosynthesis
MKKHYSIIVPVYNRPDHIQLLLECLSKQSYTNFEVLIVESGSTIKSDEVVGKFNDALDVKYIFKGNDGQGFSRNRGMKEASGEYFIILDSDILLPENYIENVNNYLSTNFLDAFGGPDKLHPSSTPFQVAANFCMTSFLTTGGTRGKKSAVGKYYPRSFNMGVSREVYEKTGGFNIPFMGEDIEWSHRIIDAGFKTGLIEKAFVNHERKSSIRTFYKQIHFFGRARINISKIVPKSFKLMHSIPILYCIYTLSLIALGVLCTMLLGVAAIPFVVYNLLILISATIKTKDLRIGFYSLVGSNALMWAYFTGMIKEFINLYILKNEQSYKL